MIEKRAAPRYKVFKRGLIALNDAAGAVECTVRNLSSIGARVDIDHPERLPPSFTLVIEADQLMRRCRPVWMTERHLGIAFE
jgi:hypothetical protein